MPRTLDASLSQALEAVQRELELAADEIDWLELRLGAPRAAAGGPAFERQALDLLSQHLGGLSTFVWRLARQCEPEWRVRPVEAAAALTLAAQKSRLGGEEPAPASPAGEFELL